MSYTGVLKTMLSLVLIFLPYTLEGFANKSVRVDFLGVKDTLLKNQLEQNVQISTYRADRQPWTKMDLQLAIAETIPHWTQLAYAHGYFDAQIRTSIRGTRCRWIISVHCHLGTRYELSGIDYWVEEKEQRQLAELPSFLQPPIYLDAQGLKMIEGKLIDHYRFQGYPYVQLLTRKLSIDTIEKTGRVEWVIAPGGRYRFGVLTIKGLKTLKPQFVLNRLQIKRGELFDPRHIEKSQSHLEATIQIKEANFHVDSTEATTGELPITLEIVETKHRTIAFGLTATTDSWVGGRLLWEHRNCHGQGDIFSASLYRNPRDSSASILHTRPELMGTWVDGRLQFEWERDSNRAYRENRFDWIAMLEKRVSLNFFYNVGLQLTRLDSFYEGDSGWHTIFSLPMNLHWSHSKETINPRRGLFYQFQWTPNWLLEAPKLAWISAIGQQTLHLPVTSHVVLDLYLKGGALIGQRLYNLPLPLRFFEGGPNCFRGYAYKTATPQDASGRLVGGSRYWLSNIETRLYLFKEVALVPFYEVGWVFAHEEQGATLKASFPSLGAGIMLETLVGPLRLDFAYPLQRRQGIDKRWELYFTLGHAG